MEAQLYVAAGLVVLLSLAHSILGERFILIRLFRRGDLPRLFGSSDFTVRTLRFAWHLTSITWLGLAAILLHLASARLSRSFLGTVIGSVFLAHFAVALFGSRGRHLSWPIFLAIGALALWATQG